MTEEEKFRVYLESQVDQHMEYLTQRMTENEEPPLEEHKIFFRNAIRAMLWSRSAPNASKDWRSELKRLGQWDQESYNYLKFMGDNSVFDLGLTSL